MKFWGLGRQPQEKGVWVKAKLEPQGEGLPPRPFLIFDFFHFTFPKNRGIIFVKSNF